MKKQRLSEAMESKLISMFSKKGIGNDAALFLKALSSRRQTFLPTKEQFVKKLNINSDVFDAMAGKLMRMGVLCLLSGVKDNQKVVYYILNPLGNV